MATAERNKAILGGTISDSPNAYFANDVSVALQVKRFADGALNELEVMRMISDVNEGQHPYILAAKNSVTVTEMLVALSKFTAEAWEKSRSIPKAVTVLATDGKGVEIAQDEKLCEDAEEMLSDFGLKPVDK